MIRIKRKFNKTRLLKPILILIIVSLYKSAISQPVYYSHYNTIISDTVVIKDDIGIKKVFYKNAKSLKSKRGKLSFMKFYKKGKVVYAKDLSGAYDIEYYYIYNEQKQLVKEYKYSNGKYSENFTDYYYGDNNKLSYTINTTKYRISKVKFEYDNFNNIILEDLYVNDWHYFRNVNRYKICDDLVQKIVLVSDTSSSFKKTDTLSVEYFDKKNKQSIYVSDKSKDLKIFTTKVYFPNGLLKAKSSQIIENENGLVSDFIKYYYVNSDDIYLYEENINCSEKKSYTVYYKIPYNIPAQLEFKFLDGGNR